MCPSPAPYGLPRPELTDSLSIQHLGAVWTPPPTSTRIFLEMSPSGVGACGKSPPCSCGPLSMTHGRMETPCLPSSYRRIRFSKPDFFFFFFWVMVGFEKKWGMGGVSFLP